MRIKHNVAIYARVSSDQQSKANTIASQIAKTTGARVVGIAGGPIKTAFLLNTLKLDGAELK